MNFLNCVTPDQARAEYSRLIQAGEELAPLTREYLEHLKQYDGKKYTVKPDNGPSFDLEFKLSPGAETAFGNIVAELHGLNMKHVQLIVRGRWLWIEGDTREFASALKARGCRYNGRRTKETGRGIWNWTPEGTRRPRRKSNMSYDQIGKAYGEERV